MTQETVGLAVAREEWEKAREALEEQGFLDQPDMLDQLFHNLAESLSQEVRLRLAFQLLTLHMKPGLTHASQLDTKAKLDAVMMKDIVGPDWANSLNQFFFLVVKV